MKNEERFSDRVSAYEKGRPGYPSTVIQRLAADLATDAVVADVGAGTGLLTREFLAAGYTVHAIEPNAPMRQAMAASLARRAGFHTWNGTAEDTGLGERSVDLIVVGQAFHWFDRQRTRPEFARILRPGGTLALIWNYRLSDSSPFMAGYEELLQRHGTDYRQVEHRNLRPAELARFFGPEGCQLWVTSNAQWLDREGLQARVESSSYLPAPGRPGHAALGAEVSQLFDAHAEQGRVRFDYDTLVYSGPLT
ncbi:class I SAM-dependent methyltransferase [Pseudomonas sp. EpS/L25]|uniref:class I SAM-dependent methyltransferase n=1 Tax=Pseudomonas sp. EpS/L25 TaxID=1749078 RepID=UPI0007435536|nr:class I SAM-dependent methyltransferase [Pseudomonas sp. EpS/L25]KUM43125.1 hypothetical protein AR540_05030 [Pseudomonas sp. EpS/L25]